MPTFALDYMNQFHCLGGDCSDICCRDWPVHLTIHDFERLCAGVNKDPLQNADILQRIVMDPAAQKQQLAGHIVWNEQNECPYLDEHRLCGLYIRLGSEAQPSICAQYPRIFLQFGSRLEMSGALSCPEIVRLLLEMDHPFGWHETSATHNLTPRQPCEELGSSLWCLEAQRVRDQFCRFMTMAIYPLPSRLIFCAFFAQRTLPEFSQGCGGDEARSALDRAMSGVGDPSLTDFLHQQMASVEASAAMAVASIQGIASHGMGEVSDHNPYFRGLMQEALAGYACDNTDAYELWQTCLARQQTLPAREKELIDQAFDRFAHHYLLQEAFLHYPDLMSYIRRLAVAVMVCRFLFFGLLGETMAVQQTLQRVFHGFSKSFSHYRMDFSELDSLPKLILFLRLW